MRCDGLTIHGRSAVVGRRCYPWTPSVVRGREGRAASPPGRDRVVQATDRLPEEPVVGPGPTSPVGFALVPTVLLATDADWIVDEVDAALADEETTVYRVRAGRGRARRALQLTPDLVVLDLQIGNMGGMATCMALRRSRTWTAWPVPILMLLDRLADVFLAQSALRPTAGWSSRSTPSACAGRPPPCWPAAVSGGQLEPTA